MAAASEAIRDRDALRLLYRLQEAAAVSRETVARDG